MIEGFSPRGIELSKHANLAIQKVRGNRAGQEGMACDMGGKTHEQVTPGKRCTQVHEQKDDVGGLKDRIQQVEEKNKELTTKLKHHGKELVELKERYETLYVLLAEMLHIPEPEETGQEMTKQTGGLQVENEEPAAENLGEGQDKSDGEPAEIEEYRSQGEKQGGDGRGGNNEQMSKKGAARETTRAIGNDKKEPVGDKDTGVISKQTEHKIVEEDESRKRNLILLGHREEMNRTKKGKGKEKEYTEKLIKGLIGKEGEKVKYNAYRLGTVREQATRPIKMTFEDVETVDKMLKNGFKLRQLRGDEKLSLRRDLTLEERTELKDKLKAARIMNSERNDKEKEQFFYKVVEGNIVKQNIRNPKRRKKQEKQVATKLLP